MLLVSTKGSRGAAMIVSVVMPVYNEVDTLEQIVRRVFDSPIPHQIELVMVDDGSTDGTKELYAKLRRQYADNQLTILEQPENRGKGAALRAGFAHAAGEVVLIQDADLEYNPQDYARLLRPIEQGKADVVYGSRFIGEEHRVLFFWHYVGNCLLTLLSNLRTNLNLSDMETCYKMFRRDVIEQITPTLREQRFGIEPELIAKVAKIPNIRVFELPISYNGRPYADGKKIGWRDGLRAIWCILRY